MRWRDRLWLRLLLALLPVNLLFLAVVLGAWLRLTEQQLRIQLEHQARSLASQLALVSAQALGSHNEWLLPEHLSRFTSLPEVARLTLVDAQGRILADSDPEKIGSAWNGSVVLEGSEPRLRYLERSAEPRDSGQMYGPRGVELFGPSFLDSPGLEVTVPMQSGGRRYGTLQLVCKLSSVQRKMRECYTVLWFGSGLMTTLSLLLLAAISRGFAQPILHVAEKAQSLASDWNQEPKTSSGEAQSEVGMLSRALDQMAASLRQLTQRQRQARLELQQRVARLLELVQRVSGGDLTVRHEQPGEGEMGRLEQGFNRMLARLVRTRQAELQARLDLEWTREALVQGNRRLAELDRRKTDFLNTASHELRTPLTSIRAFAEIVLDNEEGNQDGSAEEFLEHNREFLEIIHRESERLSRLLHSLLDLSRIESGKIDWDFETLCVETLVRSTVDSCRSLLQEKSMKLELELQEGLQLQGARDPLIQVLTNLLSNAIKFTPAGGRIVLRSRSGDDQVVMEVEDSGVGIAPEDQSKVFESFQQAEGQPDTGAPKGSGLGLAIVKQIVETHGGTIKVQSQLGKGSCFIVRLPRQHAEMVTSRQQTAESTVD